MWPLPESSRIPGIASGFAAFLTGLVAGMAQPAAMDVNAWAKAERYVSAESGSPRPGKWDPTLVPYIAEVMECLSSSHPAVDVAVVKAAQCAFTEAGLNMIGASVVADPCPILCVLPTDQATKDYNRYKLQPTIDVTPTLAERVRDVISRDESASTAQRKAFARGYIVLTGATSSKGLQMLSARKIVFEEVSEYPADAGGRGDPIAQALSRGDAWLKFKPKRYYVSTPGIKGACRITALYEASDQRRLYVPCPHCGHYQVLRFSSLKWKAAEKPYGAYFLCSSGNGCVIEPHHKRMMVARGVWIKTYPGSEDAPAPPEAFAPEELDRWRNRPSGSRQPGFHLWQAYSPFVDWDVTVQRWLDAQGDPKALKVFWQQGLGEAWEEKGEAPPAEKLVEVRENFAWRRVPAGALFITAMVDVQGDRLEFGTYAWSKKLQHGWHIDGGVLEGDPTTDKPWSELELVLKRTYEDGLGNPWDIDALGVDAGYLSNRVYMWVRKHQPRQAKEAHNPPSTRHVFALDGRPGWRLPAMGLPKTQDIDFDGKKIGAVRLWPTGTFDLKSETYTALHNLLQGPAADSGIWPLPALHFSQNTDLQFFEQLTAEHLEDVVVRGVANKIWINPQHKRNEQLDIAVGTRALGHHLADALTDAEWDALEVRRAQRPVGAQPDLAAMWAPGLEGVARDAAAGGAEVVDPSRSGPRRLSGKGRTVT